MVSTIYATTAPEPDLVEGTADAVAAEERRSTRAKLVRCAMVSVVTSVVSFVVLATAAGPLGFAPAWANVVATAAGTAPSFSLNRRWVWQHSGPTDLRRQALPFWGLSAAGLVLSTIAVGLAGAWVDAMGITGADRTGALELANLAAWGSLWLVQFAVLDRCLFRHEPATVLP